MMSDRIKEAAAMLAAARLSGMPVEGLPAPIKPRDEAEAYWVQQAVHEIIARGRYGKRVGYKIGGTATVTRKHLGIDSPCSGGLFEGSTHQSGATLDHERFRRIGIEGEIAVRMARDLEPSEAPYTAENVLGAIDSYMAAIEVVDDRYGDWRRIDAATLVADDFFGAAAVLGEPISVNKVGDPAELTGVAMIDGAEAGSGKGSDIMGHPLEALAWLATSLAARGYTLKAGEVVLLGSLAQTRWLDRPADVVFEAARLGRVELTVV